MFSSNHPEILAHLSRLQYGYQLVTLASGEVVLLIKLPKGVVLSAKINQGFKVYLVPDGPENSALGIITAFFDNEDEPFTITTPIFCGDDMLPDFTAAFSQEKFSIYLFDEHDRELMGVTAVNVGAPQFAEELSTKTFRLLDLSQAPAMLSAMDDWFSHRSAENDQAAFSITFGAMLYPDVDLEMYTSDSAKAGQEVASKLTRTEPGPFQERDVAQLLGRLFPGWAIHLNPFRTDKDTEFADVVVTNNKFLLIIHAKDSPNTEAALRRSLARKRATVMKHLEKAVKQLRGSLAHMIESDDLWLRVTEKQYAIPSRHLLVIGLIVLREMFDDQFKEYSKPVLELMEDKGVPCLVMDYASLHVITRTVGTWERFVWVLDDMIKFGVEHRTFPRPRHLGAPLPPE